MFARQIVGGHFFLIFLSFILSKTKRFLNTNSVLIDTIEMGVDRLIVQVTEKQRISFKDAAKEMIAGIKEELKQHASILNKEV